MEGEFTAAFEQDGEWWIGYIEELPGVNTQGATLEEARDNLKEALTLVIETNIDLTKKEIEGKEVILIDDSIVRGTTMGRIVNLLKWGGAAKVHVRSSCPPIRRARR